MEKALQRRPSMHTVNKLAWGTSFKKYTFTYVLLFPALALTFVFSYLPMPGIISAFQDFDIFKGLLRSPWAGKYGFEHIIDIVQIPLLRESVINTLTLSVLVIVFTFPAPILLALLLNELKLRIFKRVVQSISYIPHFLSWISIIGITMSMYSRYGPINDLRVMLFGPDTERVIFLSLGQFFIPNILILTLWQSVGWGSILYLASISGIDQSLYECAEIDGAGKFRKVLHITIPGILPTVTIMLIFTMGGLFNSNFDLVYGLQNPFVDYEVINTVVFKVGIQKQSYSMASAVGFMQGFVAFILTFAANRISKKISGIGIF